MIEKLPNLGEDNRTWRGMCSDRRRERFAEEVAILCRKINEIIDVLNERGFDDRSPFFF